jgi:hypothetical protein
MGVVERKLIKECDAGFEGALVLPGKAHDDVASDRYTGYLLRDPWKAFA